MVSVKRPKRRVIGAPKFFFADVGVVNAASYGRERNSTARPSRTGSFMN